MYGRIIDNRIQAMGGYYDTPLPDWVTPDNFFRVLVTGTPPNYVFTLEPPTEIIEENTIAMIKLVYNKVSEEETKKCFETLSVRLGMNKQAILDLMQNPIADANADQWLIEQGQR